MESKGCLRLRRGQNSGGKVEDAARNLIRGELPVAEKFCTGLLPMSRHGNQTSEFVMFVAFSKHLASASIQIFPFLG